MIHALGERRPVLEGSGHYVATSANVVGSVRLGARSSIWFNATIRGDNDWIVLGEETNVQDAAVLHTDPGLKLQVGERVTIGHRAVLHGCEVGENSLIGIGATVLNGARIGRNTVVGAHALIAEGKTFPDGVLLLGTPAKVVRELAPEEIDQLTLSAAVYVEKAARYCRELSLVSAEDY